MQKSSRALRPTSSPSPGPGLRPYVIAVVTTLAAAALTRYTWPFFSGAPFAPMFASVAATTHWGSGAAGLLTVLLGTIVAPLAFPSDGRLPWNAITLVGFVPVALIGSRLIAGRNQAVAALRASEAELRATWEHATLGAALLNRSGEVERINPALERLLGYSGPAARGQSFSAFCDPDEGAAEQERFARFIDGSETFYQREQRCRRKDGDLIWARVTVSAIRGVGGATTGALAVLEDVTAQRQAEADLRASEEKLRRAQKMEAVGQLVAGVAHNFNNLLTITMGYADVLMDEARDDHQREAIEEIRKATERGAALTRQLLAFGRKHDARLARVDLNRTVGDLRETLTRVISDDIQLTVDVEGGPLSVIIDPHDLEQVVFILVVNARDAMPEGGTIHVGVALERFDAANPPADPAAGPGDYVRLRVRDNGTGMGPDVQAHLFEPFFTTKDVGKGTGLGLAFVHGIARHGGGFVAIESAPAQGTTVSVYLPPAPETGAPGKPGGTAG